MAKSRSPRTGHEMDSATPEALANEETNVRRMERIARRIRPETLALLWQALRIDLWQAQQRDDATAMHFCERILDVVVRVAQERGVILSEGGSVE